MSLATRCTSCGTVFRVVQDQLKVSEGWVRCGQCDAVFNALQGLFDLERDAPPEWTPTAAHGDAPTQASATSVSTHESYDVATPPGFEDLDPVQAEGPEYALRRSEADGRLLSRDPSSRADPIGSVETEETAPDVRIEQCEDPSPVFLRKSLRPSRWESAGTRITMTVVASVLLLGFAGQAVHHFRDLMAARMPALKPALNTWCIVASCSIEAVRKIEEIAVESSALTRIQAPDTFRLGVTLRNRSAMEIALPSIELSLTDSTGTVLARRSLSPRDFRVAAPRMQASSESALQVTLSTGNSNISGYTVEIFYP